MNRTELIKYANNLYKSNRFLALPLRTCKAQILETDVNGIYLLRSYNTIVAIFSSRTGSMYVFDRYSQTTYQHIYKFAHDMEVDRIVWLYKRSDRVVETAISWHANTLKTLSYSIIESCDWAINIEQSTWK